MSISLTVLLDWKEILAFPYLALTILLAFKSTISSKPMANISTGTLKSIELFTESENMKDTQRIAMSLRI